MPNILFLHYFALHCIVKSVAKKMLSAILFDRFYQMPLTNHESGRNVKDSLKYEHYQGPKTHPSAVATYHRGNLGGRCVERHPHTRVTRPRRHPHDGPPGTARSTPGGRRVWACCCREDRHPRPPPPPATPRTCGATPHVTHSQFNVIFLCLANYFIFIKDKRKQI